MAKLGIERVLELPGTLTPSTLYFVQGADSTDLNIYLVGNDVSEVRHSPTTAEIQGMITSAMAGFTNPIIVEDIEARDALDLDTNALVLVMDATDDPTVDHGGAMYFYDAAGEVYVKVAEFESMDLVVAWGDVTGRPASTPNAIDTAVTDSHTHSNKSVLDKFSEVANELHFDGEPIGTHLTVAEW